MVTLKELRRGKGISQTDLALMLQETRGGKGYQGPISAIESGRNSPTVKRLTDIVETLGYELKITVKAKSGPTITLDLDSLQGNVLRAKDTRREESMGHETELSSPVQGPEDQDSQSEVESLIMTILNK